MGIHCQSPSQKHHYTSAWAAGVKLAEEMIKNGAATILADAKATTKREILEEHEAKKAEKERIAAASACPMMESKPECMPHTAPHSLPPGGAVHGVSHCPASLLFEKTIGDKTKCPQL